MAGFQIIGPQVTQKFFAVQENGIVIKCKEMTLRFRRVVDHLPSALAIDTKALESVDAHKVLGVTLQSNLKWDLHINEVVAKASKRLHILRVLKRGGVPPADLLKVYFALTRSVSCVA